MIQILVPGIAFLQVIHLFVSRIYFCVINPLLVFTFARAGYGSESEADDEAATVSLPSDVDKLNQASRKSAVRLQEIGPRMTMRLVKVEAGLCSGDVLYPWPGEFPLML